MKVYFEGASHLTHWSKVGASARGLQVCWHSYEADLICIAHDTPTDENGNRNLGMIQELIKMYRGERPVLLMSQVPPGFCRKQNMPNLYHYPETLRISDSYHRAVNPEYIIIGCMTTYEPDIGDGGIQHERVMEYVNAFNCPFMSMSYEEAEFSKIAVNMMLAAQVDYANRMADAGTKIGANWDKIAGAIKHDKRIGSAYLIPGRWQDSLHLLRDYLTLKEIEDAR